MPMRDVWDERIRMVTKGGMAAVADGVIERWFTEAFRREPTVELERVQRMILETPPHGYAACCAAIRDMDLRELITGIRVPTLVIVGEDDPATPTEKAKEIQSLIPGAQLEVVPGAAHLLNIEQDVVFDAALKSLLDRHRA
jgi:3-oxoadipate enol-lactonase